MTPACDYKDYIYHPSDISGSAMSPRGVLTRPEYQLVLRNCPAVVEMEFLGLVVAVVEVAATMVVVEKEEYRVGRGPVVVVDLR